MYTIISAKRLNNGAPGSSIYTKSGAIRKDCEVKTLDDLRDNTQVIEFNNGIIIADF